MVSTLNVYFMLLTLNEVLLHHTSLPVRIPPPPDLFCSTQRHLLPVPTRYPWTPKGYTKGADDTYTFIRFTCAIRRDVIGVGDIWSVSLVEGSRKRVSIKVTTTMSPLVSTEVSIKV